ncbi:MAG: hypothetical protein M1503_09210 [Thaumarchaeota archaeon]|nr:hypothetical protein [Nitrososphaerota archaeon]
MRDGSINHGQANLSQVPILATNPSGFDQRDVSLQLSAYGLEFEQVSFVKHCTASSSSFALPL